MKANKNLLWIAVVLLVVVDALTFHDLAESHSLRDWLTLAASVLVLAYFFKVRSNN